MKKPSNLLFSFDVESIGLQGQGFAVGGVLVNKSTRVVEDRFCYAVNSELAAGPLEGRRWITANCPPIPVTHHKLSDMYAAFIEKLDEAMALGADILTDCGWPVEANFLTACLGLSPGPYPLLDLSSILLAKGFNPIGTYGRLPEELPNHHPTCDAQQTARLYLDHMHPTGRVEFLDEVVSMEHVELLERMGIAWDQNSCLSGLGLSTVQLQSIMAGLGYEVAGLSLKG